MLVAGIGGVLALVHGLCHMIDYAHAVSRRPRSLTTAAGCILQLTVNVERSSVVVLDHSLRTLLPVRAAQARQSSDLWGQLIWA